MCKIFKFISNKIVNYLTIYTSSNTIVIGNNITCDDSNRLVIKVNGISVDTYISNKEYELCSTALMAQHTLYEEQYRSL